MTPGRTPAQESTRGGFLGFVAHEIRNPLATALWSAELLARLSPEERGGARGEKLVGMALRAMQKLRHLVEDHFLAERLDVAGLPVRSEQLSLRELIEGAAQRTRTEAQVTVDVEEGASLVGDRAMLERALEGLVAVVTRESAHARVTFAAEEGRAVVTFSGAPPAPDALLPPQKGTASDPSGRALALYMAAKVAAALGGSLAVEEVSYVLRLPASS